MIITKTFTCFCPSIADELDSHLTAAKGKFDVKFKKVSSIYELFPLLSDSKFHTDFIGIDIEELYKVDGSDIYDIVNTLHTLINCTVVRHGKGKPVKRTTKIIAVAGEDTPVNLIKEAASIKEIYTIGARAGATWGATEYYDSLLKILTGNQSLPCCIQDRLKPKKATYSQHASPTVQLTDRQLQIFNIVVNRGCSNKHIAQMLGLSESTVKLHMSAIFKKFGVKNRTQLAVFSKGI